MGKPRVASSSRVCLLSGEQQTKPTCNLYIIRRVRCIMESSSWSSNEQACKNSAMMQHQIHKWKKIYIKNIMISNSQMFGVHGQRETDGHFSLQPRPYSDSLHLLLSCAREELVIVRKLQSQASSILSLQRVWVK